MKQKWISFLLGTLCLSCMHAAPENSEPASEEQQPQPSAVVGIDNRKLVRKANYRFEVEDVSRAASNIERIIARYPAIIVDSQMESYPTRIQQTITIRVEAQYFEAFIKDVDQEPNSLDTRTITTTDFTKEFVDLEARLATKREVFGRFIEILRNKTASVEDILATERQIGHLQEEIESAVSRFNYLTDQVAYSTISIEVYQHVTLHASVTEPGLGEELASAFNAGFDGITYTLILLIHLWPIIIVGGTAWLIVVYRRRMQIFEVTDNQP
ncbi:MAG TPA: DUF4349 domain-containing protein [Ohtaekwangia sp.]|nr:DUF4349 domain-containing protein [Ohtaekwangia sp.]